MFIYLHHEHSLRNLWVLGQGISPWMPLFFFFWGGGGAVRREWRWRVGAVRREWRWRGGGGGCPHGVEMGGGVCLGGVDVGGGGGCVCCSTSCVIKKLGQYIAEHCFKPCMQDLVYNKNKTHYLEPNTNTSIYILTITQHVPVHTCICKHVQYTTYRSL